MYPTDPRGGSDGRVEWQTRRVPDIGLIRPAMVLRSVVLPTPDEPVMATISPDLIDKSGTLTRGLLGSYPITNPSSLTT